MRNFLRTSLVAVFAAGVGCNQTNTVPLNKTVAPVTGKTATQANPNSNGPGSNQTMGGVVAGNKNCLSLDVYISTLKQQVDIYNIYLSAKDLGILNTSSFDFPAAGLKEATRANFLLKQDKLPAARNHRRCDLKSVLVQSYTSGITQNGCTTVTFASATPGGDPQVFNVVSVSAQNQTNGSGQGLLRLLDPKSQEARVYYGTSDHLSIHVYKPKPTVSAACGETIPAGLYELESYEVNFNTTADTFKMNRDFPRNYWRIPYPRAATGDEPPTSLRRRPKPAGLQSQSTPRARPQPQPRPRPRRSIPTAAGSK